MFFKVGQRKAWQYILSPFWIFFNTQLHWDGFHQTEAKKFRPCSGAKLSQLHFFGGLQTPNSKCCFQTDWSLDSSTDWSLDRSNYCNSTIQITTKYWRHQNSTLLSNYTSIFTQSKHIKSWSLENWWSWQNLHLQLKSTSSFLNSISKQKALNSQTIWEFRPSQIHIRMCISPQPYIYERWLTSNSLSGHPLEDSFIFHRTLS